MKLIRFANKKSFLFTDEIKGDIKKQMIQRWNIQFEKDYQFLTEDDLPMVKDTKIYLNTFGHSYYLYFTKFNKKNTAIMFDKWKEQAYFVRFRVDDILYYDTLFEGELIKQTDGNWSYQIIDLISHEGEDVRHLHLDKRIEMIDHFLKEQYIYDPVFQPCQLERTLYLGPEYLDWLISAYIPSRLYRCNGINFKLQTYGEHYLYIFEEYATKKRKPTSKEVALPMPKIDYDTEDGDDQESDDEVAALASDDDLSDLPRVMEAVIAVKKTDKPDVYELFVNSGDDMYIHIDYAYIKDVEHSQQVSNAIRDTMEEYELEVDNGEYPEIPFLCRYVMDFKKWMPIKVSLDDVIMKEDL